MRLYLLSVIVIVSAVLVGCKDETWEREVPETVEYGTISLSNLSLELSGISFAKSEQPEIEVKDFVLEIKRISQNTLAIDPFYYGDINENPTISLPTGSYVINVKGGTLQNAAFDSPYYEGTSEEFTIEPNSVTEPGTIICNVANVAVQVVIENNLYDMIDDIASTSVTVYYDPEYPLVFGVDDLYYRNHTGREGYFEWHGTTMVATFVTSIDGVEFSDIKTLTPLEKGQCRIISYSIKEAESGTGSAAPDIVIDVAVDEKPLTDIVFSDDDTPYEGEITRPGDDDTTGDGSGDDDPKDNPDIEAKIEFSSDDINLDELNDAELMSTAVLKITATAGIEKLEVEIGSEKGTAQGVLADVEIPPYFDLAALNPGEKLFDTFTGFGFIPEDGIIKGKTELPFDITRFLELMPALGSDELKWFIVTVTDSKGNSNSVTLKFK